MGSDRKGTAVKDISEMTAREILDAVRSGLEETSRRFADDQPKQPLQRPQPAAPEEVSKVFEGTTAKRPS
jgi:hypothetical protein